MRSEPPLHIGYLIQDFPPEVGAGPARVTEMSLRWQALGARVTVITGMPNRRIPGRGEGRIDARYRGKVFMEESWQGIRVLRSWVFAAKRRGFGATVLNNISFMTSGIAHAIARGDRPDVLIASSPPFLPHLAGVALARAWRIPLVLEIRDLWPDYLVQMGMLRNERAQRALFALERWLLRHAAHVVVVTESFKQRIVEKGVPAERITVIPNGVDVSNYRPLQGHKPVPSMASLVRDVTTFNVGYLGTFGRGQGLIQVVEAAAILAERDPEIQIALVGDGPDREAIQRAIAERGLRNIVIAPPIAREDTVVFYNWCDVCLVPLAPIPIFQETIPSKIFEVMACERPLVACVDGEAAAIVESSQGGLRVDPGDGRQLAEAILAVRALAPADRAAMGRRAREYASANFDRTALADRYHILLLQLGRGRAGSAAG